MTRMEFCKAVLTGIGGKWLYTGALADASSLYDKKKSVEQAVTEIKTKYSRKMNAR
jgi:hypothetical protein